MAPISKKSARPFTMVRRSLWGSDRFAGLPDDQARYLYLYLLTCPHQTSCGCFILKEAYALADLAMVGSDWTLERFRHARQALIEAELIQADDATGEILITRWWQDNSPNNESWFKGARVQCEAIKSPELQNSALEALEAHWRDFRAASGLPANFLNSQRTASGTSGEDKIRILSSRLGAAI